MTKTIVLTIKINESNLVETELIRTIDTPIAKAELNAMVLSGIGELMRFFEEYAMVYKYKYKKVKK